MYKIEISLHGKGNFWGGHHMNPRRTLHNGLLQTWRATSSTTGRHQSCSSFIGLICCTTHCKYNKPTTNRSNGVWTMPRSKDYSAPAAVECNHRLAGWQDVWRRRGLLLNYIHIHLLFTELAAKINEHKLLQRVVYNAFKTLFNNTHAWTVTCFISLFSFFLVLSFFSYFMVVFLSIYGVAPETRQLYACSTAHILISSNRLN